MKVVKSYLDGEGGLGSIAKQYGIGSETQVKTWVNAYKTLGTDGLKRKKQLLEIYKTPEKIYSLNKNDLLKIKGIGNETINNIRLTI